MSTAQTWTNRIWMNFVALFGVRPSPAESADLLARAPLQIQLQQFLQIRASRMRSVKTFPIMMEAIGENGFLFKTQELSIQEGENLQFEALLRGVGLVKLSGKVEWLLRGSIGYSGEMRMELQGESQIQWARFVRLQSQGLRGSTV